MRIHPEDILVRFVYEMFRQKNLARRVLNC